MVALESIGAAIESLRPGLACFDARGLLRLYGSDPGRGRVGSKVTKQDVEAVLAVVRRALRTSARFGVAPTRFAALAAATRARARAPLILAGDTRQAREFLAPMSVELLCGGVGGAELRSRDDLPKALAEMEKIPGVTVIIYDQQCAADAERVVGAVLRDGHDDIARVERLAPRQQRAVLRLVAADDVREPLAVAPQRRVG